MGTLEELIGMTTGDDTEEAIVTFVVEDSTELNNSVVHLSPVTMDDLNIWYGVAILLEGSHNRKAVCTVLTDENCGGYKIRMNEVVRNKFGVSLGDSVTLGSFLEIPKGRKIVVRPIRDECDFVQENLLESYLRPYFFGANRPVNNGDVFSVKGRARTIQFKVIKTLPSPFCVVGPSTIIYCEEQKVANKRRKKEAAEVSKKAKGPICLQSIVTAPDPDGDEVPNQNADPVQTPKVDKLPMPAVNKFPAPTVDKLPAPTVDELLAPPVDEPTNLEDKIALAHSLHAQGRLRKARKAFREIKEAQAKKLGRKHPEMLPIRLALATIMCNLGKYVQLSNVFLKDQQLQNCWDPAFLDLKLLIAMVLTEQQKFEDATRILYGAFDRRKSMKLHFVKELKVKVLLATALHFQNKWEDALKVLSHETLQGPEFPDIVAKFYYVLKNLTKHKNLKLCSLTQTKQDVLIIKCYIGWFYYQLNDDILATQAIQEILPFMKKKMGSDHFYSKFAETHLQDCKKQLVQERERQLY